MRPMPAHVLASAQDRDDAVKPGIVLGCQVTVALNIRIVSHVVPCVCLQTSSISYIVNQASS